MEQEAQTSALFGLTDEQVAERVASGLTNANTDPKTKSIKQIFAEHTFTLFNGINVFLAVIVLFTGQLRNMAFMGVVFFNMAVGIVQEVRAKQMVDRLTILTTKQVKAIRSATTSTDNIRDYILSKSAPAADTPEEPDDFKNE